jgi:hypothetical protein
MAGIGQFIAALVAGLAALGGPHGTVGGVVVDRNGAQLASDPNGRVERVGAFPEFRRARTVISPDGRWKAVLHLPGISGNTGTVSLGPNRAGAPLRLVEAHLYAGTAQATWSADSRWLALVVWVPHLLSAVAVSPDGRRRVLAAPFCGDFQGDLAWEQHGDRIALDVPAPGPSCKQGIGLRVRTVEGGRGRVIAAGISGVPSWSADGRWIATSGEAVDAMRADGRRRMRLGYGLATWSPRGDVIAVVEAQTQTLRVGSITRGLARWDSPVLLKPMPAFTRDGRRLAYARPGVIMVRRVADARPLLAVPTGGEIDLWRLTWTSGGRSLRIDALAVDPD